jgi:CxxC-x17-CxxC domain-containing protein
MKNENVPRKFLMQNTCKVCGKESTTAVQIYPSQAWEYYCRKCYEKMKR